MSGRSILVRIATTVPARLWSGVGDLFVPVDAVETDADARYLGGGELLDGLNDIEQLINGTAARLDVRVSGVSLATQRLAVDEAADVKGKAVDVGVVEFDDLGQLSRVTWRAHYRADKLAVANEGSSRIITLSMGSEDTGRSRAPISFWTHADQQRRSPGDRIFERVSGINGGTSRLFGPT